MVRAGVTLAASRAAAAFVLAAALTGCATSSREQPAGRFVYSGDPITHSNVGGLFVVEANGGDPGKVTAGPVHTIEENADWSPDGSRIVFERAYDCAAVLGVCLALWVVNADGRAEERLTPQDAQGVTTASEPTWSPDGRRIAYVSYDDRLDVSDVWVMNADGSKSRRVTQVGDANGSTWAPDGRKIAFSHDFDIYAVDVETGSLERLTKTPAVDESDPDWSPHGQRIAYGLVSEGSGPLDESDVYAMNIDGTHERRLSRRGEYDAEPVWSPDGSFIAYGSTPASGVGLAIVIVDADTGRRVQRILAPGMVSYGIDWTAG